jgi:hypothetical protein
VNPLFQNTARLLERRGAAHQSVFDARPVILPKLSTPQGGRRRLVQSAPLVTNVGGDAAYGTDPALFTIENPSTRLHLKVALGYRPDAQETEALAVGWLATMDAWDRDEYGRPMRSNNIFTNSTVPLSWEAVTANDQWRGSVATPTHAGGGTAAEPGQLIVIATWEPAPGWNGADEELGQIFQACRLVVTRGILVSNGNV